MRKTLIESSFEKSLKTLRKKHYPMNKVAEVIDSLCEADGILHGRYHDYALSGNLSGYRELHIEPNVLLLYKLTNSEIILVKIGTHDELFK